MEREAMTEKRKFNPDGPRKKPHLAERVVYASSSGEPRKFNPNGGRKKPFYDTKRKKLVIPATCNGNQPSGLPACGLEASGIPAAGEKALTIERKWDHLSPVPVERGPQNELGMHMLDEIYSGRYSDPGLFAISLGYNPYKFKLIAESNEYFKDCLEIANYIIGQKLIEKARNREEDGNVNMKLLPRYDKEYRQMVEELKAKEGARAAAATMIYVERVPDSPLVPTLRKDKEDV
jgi:hypothetical protein